MFRILAMLMLAGCSAPQGLEGVAGSNGTGCSVKQLSNGAIISCGNTNAIILNGRDFTPPGLAKKEISE
jgi:hypothetical protein